MSLGKLYIPVFTKFAIFVFLTVFSALCYVFSNFENRSFCACLSHAPSGTQTDAFSFSRTSGKRRVFPLPFLQKKQTPAFFIFACTAFALFVIV